MDMGKIKESMEIYPEKGRMPCPVAHYIASYLQIEPLEVGKAADALGIVLYQCQLGLFGYGRKGESSYKILGRKVELTEEILDRIRRKASKDRTISCRDLWSIADETGVVRAEIGNAADALGLKIKPCQLGAF
jgi:hypothetical protein